MEGLTAEVKVYNMDGKSVEAYTQSAIVNSPSNSTVQCFTIGFNKERKNLSLNKPTFCFKYHLWTAFGCYGWEKRYPLGSGKSGK